MFPCLHGNKIFPIPSISCFFPDLPFNYQFYLYPKKKLTRYNE
ncbi:Uncharacterized protein dnl_13220 [Desulfonema limicola]|uniref:Uncharacterized protein n=1 Tax=Desulfonema limicola TaxID=45656 RepID=A0A975B5A6_9BACT|nr:Uncharacterized protein dnl_13220 [Desulfonema limicola]